MIIKERASKRKDALLSVYAEQAKIIHRIAIWQVYTPNTPFYRDYKRYSDILTVKNNEAQDLPLQDTIENMYALTGMYITAVEGLIEQSSNNNSLWMQVKDLHELHEDGCVPIYKEIIRKEKEKSRAEQIIGAVSSFFLQTDTELDYSTYDNFIHSWDNLYEEVVRGYRAYENSVSVADSSPAEEIAA